MQRLIYSSQAVVAVDQTVLDGILESARQHNTQHRISGALLYKNGYFVQLIEGPRDEVNALYERILTDPLHEKLTLLHLEETQERLFKDWYMAPISSSSKFTFMAYANSTDKGEREFNPESLSSSQALHFFENLAESYPDGF